MVASIVLTLLTFASFARWIHADHTVALNVTTLTSTRLPKPLSDGTAVLLDQTIYIHGGCDSPNGNEFAGGFFSCASISNASYAFHTKNYSMTTLPDMPTPRYRHAAVVLRDQIVLLGGRSVSDELIATVDVYNTSSKNWTSYDLDDAYVVSDLAGFAFQDRAYFCGGYNQNYTAQGTCFRLEEPVASTGRLNITDVPPLPTPRADIASVTYGNYALVSGGFTHANDFCAPLTTTERLYFPELAWTELDDLTVGRGDKVLVKTSGDDEETAPHIYAIGGERQIDDICTRNPDDPPLPGEETILLDDVEVYDVASDMWTQIQDLPEQRFRFVAVGAGHIIYSFGGQYSFNDTCQCFPTSDEVTLYTEIAAEKNDTNKNGSSGGARTKTTWFAIGITAAMCSWMMMMTTATIE